MALTIGTNVASLQASAAASSVNRDLETSMARLSTGKRINSAADDAAGVAIASRLSSEIRGTDQAIRNALDGQALIDTAEGGHKEIEEILQRMREIAIQSANDTNSAQDRGNLQAEMDALTSEINRIAGVTTWASNSVMDGGGSTSKTFSLQIGAATGTKNQIAVAIGAMDAATLTVGKTSSMGDVTNGTITTKDGGGANNFVVGTGTAGSITIDSITFSNTGQADKDAVAADLVAQINASDAMQSRGITAAVDGTTAAKVNMSFAQGSDVFVDTAANARTGITAIDAAILKVNTQRSELGAVSIV